MGYIGEDRKKWENTARSVLLWGYTERKMIKRLAVMLLSSVIFFAPLESKKKCHPKCHPKKEVTFFGYLEKRKRVKGGENVG